MAWINHTRLDIACAVSFASPGAEKNFQKWDISMLNMLVIYLRETSEMRMKFPQLDQDSLYILAYADSSFAD